MIDAVLGTLNLPADALVGQRIPKKLFLENGAPTSADKRILTEGIQEAIWVAALKPTTCGVSAFRDDVREYLEIAVVRVMLKPQSKVARLVNLLHRAIPYPVVLLLEDTSHVSLSLAHKRWSQNAHDNVVLDGDIVEVAWSDSDVIDDERGHALGLANQPRTHLFDLYQGWMNVLIACRAADITGSFVLSQSRDATVARRQVMLEYERLGAEVARLRSVAAKEKQISRLVDINMELKRTQARCEELRALL